MWHQESLVIETEGRGLYEISRLVSQSVVGTGVKTGVCHLFIRHTSASLIISENADPVVLDDLEAYFNRLVPDGDSLYRHTLEGVDDMPAHVRSVLTQTSLTLPVVDGRLGLGVWQGVYLWEHRFNPHRRTCVATIEGES